MELNAIRVSAFRAMSGSPRGHTVSVRVGFHDCRRDLVLKKNEHPLVSREPGIHFCKQINNAPSTDIELPVVSECDQREMQGRLARIIFSTNCIDRSML